MPLCRYGKACRSKKTCKFVHDPCQNPACIAREKQNTHENDRCGVLDPSRSPEEQRQAHKDFIAEKRKVSMEAAAERKAKKAAELAASTPWTPESATEAAPAVSDKPPDEGAAEAAPAVSDKLARDLAGGWLYPRIKSVLEDEDVAETAAEFIRARPTCYAARPGINLAGSITGMHLENCKTPKDFSDLLAWSEDEVREAAMEGLETLFESPA